MERFSHVSVDVVMFEGEMYLHSIDHATRWSEVRGLLRKYLDEQERMFDQTVLNRHGALKRIMADGEYAKGKFKRMCQHLDI